MPSAGERPGPPRQPARPRSFGACRTWPRRAGPPATTLSELRAGGHVTGVRPYWVFNGFAATVDQAGLRSLASLPQVASVTADEEIELPEPDPQSAPKLPTWGVERVRATDVWGQFA